MILREIKRKKLFKKYNKIKNNLKKIIKNPKTSLKIKEIAKCKIQKIPKNSSISRLRNRCWITGRSRGYYGMIGMCRNMFRHYAMNGYIPGIKKSSW